MKKIYSVILLLAVMLSSCTKDETDIMTDDNSNAPALAKTRSDGSDMVEYELLPNPYTVDVIREFTIRIMFLRLLNRRFVRQILTAGQFTTYCPEKRL